ncbi:MAG: hypothetical protein KatS3mg052_0115 [Candidatus Roseilinea sp.]|nr:MAG: hypothetical protein KatS3mg052_0115 [Candidatus Roseilinea sp.]
MALQLLHLYFYQRRAPRILRLHAVFPRLGLLRAHRIAARPGGVIGIIAPWNYPFTLSMKPPIAARVAGNAVALKPKDAAVVLADVPLDQTA